VGGSKRTKRAQPQSSSRGSGSVGGSKRTKRAQPQSSTKREAEGRKPKAMARRRELWSVEEPAIDSDEAMGINAQAVKQLGHSEKGWARLQMEARDILRVDVSPLCSELDRLNGQGLPRGMVHLWIEPVLAHLTGHRCWHGAVQEEVCGLARCLYVLGSALKQQRMEAWRVGCLDSIRTVAKGARKYAAELAAQRDALGKGFEGEEVKEKTALMADLSRHAQGLQQYADDCEAVIKKHTGSALLLARKSTARPALVFAEAELLATPGIDEGRVAALIVELDTPMNPRKRVEGRAALPTYQLQLRIAR